MKIGIVGHGFVGKAVDSGFVCEKIIVDPKLGNDITVLHNTDAEFIFVCVPTPMGKFGAIDSSIVESTVTYLKHHTNSIIIVKSTVTPDIIDRLTSDEFGDRVVYNPEFLTERNYKHDFINPSMHVFGGKLEVTRQVANLYYEHSLCNEAPTWHISAIEASFVKYGINTFLATKVLWMNQFYDMITKFGAGSYETISRVMVEDKRIGASHMKVPGIDNKRGFGGACFTKDTAAFSNFTNGAFSVLEEVINKNNEYRNLYELDEREKEQNVSYR